MWKLNFKLVLCGKTMNKLMKNDPWWVYLWRQPGRKVYSFVSAVTQAGLRQLEATVCGGKMATGGGELQCYMWGISPEIKLRVMPATYVLKMRCHSTLPGKARRNRHYSMSVSFFPNGDGFWCEQMPTRYKQSPWGQKWLCTLDASLCCASTWGSTEIASWGGEGWQSKASFGTLKPSCSLLYLDCSRDWRDTAA